MTSFGSILRRLFEKSKRVSAVILFGVVVVSSFSVRARPELLVGAVLAFAAVLLSLILEMHKKITEVPSVLETGLPHAWPLIEHEIRKALSRRDSEICWLGVTLNDAWPNLVTVLQPALTERAAFNLTIRLTQVDPSYLREIAGPDSELPQYAEANWVRICSFERDHNADLVATGSRIVKNRYTHMPNFHGVLINGVICFLSAVSWEGSRMQIAEQPYERFETATQLGQHKIQLFKSWLARAEVKQPNRSAKPQGIHRS